MLLKIALTLLFFATSVLTAPTSSPKSISARDTTAGPTVQSGYSPQETEQIHQAHLDAIKLIVTPYDNSSPDVNDRIFAKYFPLEHKPYVYNVLNQITNNADAPDAGNRLLSQINVVRASPNGVMMDSACNDPKTYAQLRHWTDDHPFLIVCPRAFKHGSFDGPKWPGVQDINCDSIGTRVSWKMMTLGTIFVQKYTYFKVIEAEALKGFQGFADDIADGPINVLGLPWYQAVRNGDSYAWFVTEMAWALHCGREFDAPAKGDDEDPN